MESIQRFGQKLFFGNVKMLKSKCIVCNKIYNTKENGKGLAVEHSHGYCPDCLKKIIEKKNKNRGKLIYRYKKSDQKK